MLWRFMLATLMLTLGIGCPHDWMKGGSNDRAAHKDTKESLQELQACPDGMERVEDCSRREENGDCSYSCE